MGSGLYAGFRLHPATNILPRVRPFLAFVTRICHGGILSVWEVPQGTAGGGFRKRWNYHGRGRDGVHVLL
jgi:hypothetical protein